MPPSLFHPSSPILPVSSRSTMKRLRQSQRINTDLETAESSSSTRRSKSMVALKTKLKPKPKPKPKALPHPIEYDLLNMRCLTADFFQIDALQLAPLLLGKFLRRDDVVLQITEVEAYMPNDSACHARFGITPRTAPVFGGGGHAYVYLCYGLHVMLNVVADKEGIGAAVLVRAAAPVAGIPSYVVWVLFPGWLLNCYSTKQGLKTIQQRRGRITEKPVLLTGPGKVGQALGLTTEWSNHPLYEPGGLELLDGPKPENILVGPRVGIEYALPEHVTAPWRFAIAGSPWISAPKNTLHPPSY